MKRRYWAVALFSFATVLAVWGCETALEPDYVLDRPRVLALRSDPVALLPDASTVLDALLYLPPGSPAPQYEWTWCARVGNELTCTVTSDELTAALDPDGGLGLHFDYALGNGASATFLYPGTAAALEAACRQRAPTRSDAGEDDAGDDAGDAGDGGADAGASDGGVTLTTGDGGIVTLNCSNGGVSIDVLLTATVGGTQLKAVRTITVYYTAPSSTDTNPTVSALGAFNGNDVPDAVADGVFPAGNVNLLALVPSSATDSYPGRINDAGVVVQVTSNNNNNNDDNGPGGGNDGPNDASSSDASTSDSGVFESLTMSWFVERGRLADASTRLAAAETDASRDFTPLEVNRWTVSDPGTYTVIVVVRDNRGGVGWLTKTITIGAKP